jgi:hypothetical protein
LWLNNVAEKYRINLKGSGKPVTIKFDPTLDVASAELGVTRWKEVTGTGENIIRIGRLDSEAQAANTIAHELSHAREFIQASLKGASTLQQAQDLGYIKPHGNEFSQAGNGTPYGSGNALQEFIEGRR